MSAIVDDRAGTAPSPARGRGAVRAFLSSEKRHE